MRLIIFLLSFFTITAFGQSNSASQLMAPAYKFSTRSVGTVGKVNAVQGDLLLDDSPDYFSSNANTSFYFLNNPSNGASGQTYTDDSGNARNLTSAGVSFSNPGFYGRKHAMYTKGTGGLSSTSTFFDPADVTFSVGGWFALDDWTPSASSQALIGNFESGNGYLILVTTVGEIYFYTSSGTPGIQTTAGIANPFTNGSWHHFALTYSSTSPDNVWRAYIDGIFIGSTTNVNDDITSQTFRIGANAATAANFMSGRAQEVFFSTNGTGSPLTDDNINQIYSKRYSNHNQIQAGHFIVNDDFPITVTGNKVHYWNLNDCNGTDCSDGSGNGETVAWVGTGSFAGRDIFGVNDVANFTGSNNLSVSSTDLSIGGDGGPISMGCWAASDSWLTNNISIITDRSSAGASANSIAQISQDALDNITYDFYGTSSNISLLMSTTNLVPTSWHFLALSSDGKHVYSYLDGQVAANEFSAGSNILNSDDGTDTIKIGSTFNDTARFVGRIQSCFHAKVFLTPDEMFKIYSARLNHNKNIPIDTQSWAINFKTEESDLWLPLDPTKRIMDSSLNDLYLKFDDLTPGNSVLIRSR